jgi:hypothetical protein
MKLKTISLFSLALLVVFACQTEAKSKKEVRTVKKKAQKETEVQAQEVNPKDTTLLISGADSVLISKKKVVEDWDKQWSKVVYQFYNASLPLAKWQLVINNFIRKGLHRTDGQAPYTAPLSTELIHKSLLAFKKEAQPYAEESIWNMTDTFQIDDHFASFACVKWYSSSNTGGAHGMYGIGYYYFDKVSAKTMGIKDLLQVNEGLLKLAEGLFRKSVGIKANTPFENTEYSFGGRFYLPDNFKITANEITFIYNPYEVSNWANGVVEFSMPLRQIKPYLKRTI